MSRIASIGGLEVLDSRGNPTVCARCTLESGATGVALAPSGASTGSREALELRDGGKRYGGKGVAKAVAGIEREIAPKLRGCEATDQLRVDSLLVDLDGTSTKGRLGANATVAVSLAVAKAAAAERHTPLYRYLGGVGARILPVPLLNVLNGGAHADNAVDIQEFMIVPLGFERFGDALAAGVETYHKLKSILLAAGKTTAVGDEGGFAPELDSNQEALDLLVEAIGQAGYEPGKEIALALDVAASELAEAKGGEIRYGLPGEGRADLTAESLIDTYAEWAERYPLVSIEDGLDENDWGGWKVLTERLGSRLQLVGDDLFVTNASILARGIREGIANALLVKLNQIGTLSETLDAMALARSAAYANVVSHRSGETEDTTIADLAVATESPQIKTGAPCRSDRVAKYNRLLAIEAELGPAARYAGRHALRRATI